MRTIRTAYPGKNKSLHNGQNHPKAKSDTQKKTLHASEKYTERVQKLRAEYWTIIGEVNLTDLVFIDEAGVNIAMTLASLVRLKVVVLMVIVQTVGEKM